MDFLQKIKWTLYIVLGILTFVTGFFMLYSIIKYAEAKRDQNTKPDILRYMSRSMIFFILFFLINVGILFYSIYTIKVSIPKSIEKGVESILLALQTVSQTPQK